MRDNPPPRWFYILFLTARGEERAHESPHHQSPVFPVTLPVLPRFPVSGIGCQILLDSLVQTLKKKKDFRECPPIITKGTKQSFTIKLKKKEKKNVAIFPWITLVTETRLTFISCFISFQSG